VSGEARSRTRRAPDSTPAKLRTGKFRWWNLIPHETDHQRKHPGRHAVVAGEVKNLAGQAKQATDRITSEIATLNDISGGVLVAPGGIKEAIDNVDEFMASTAAAEEQGVVTATCRRACRRPRRSLRLRRTCPEQAATDFVRVGGSATWPRACADP
jgi:hypothetical protein